MELNYLRAFYEVARAGSFSEAARRLHISQSSLSKAVALLEHRQGVKLLKRSKAGVALTTVGSEVYLKAERIFQLVTEVEVTCSGNKESCEGPLPFGASDHITNYLLVDPLQAFTTAHPKATPSVFSGTPNEIIALILSNEIEFGLFFTKIALTKIKYEVLRTVEMVAVAHPRFNDKTLRATVHRAGFIGSIKSQYQVHPSRVLMDQMGEGVKVVCESSSQETQKRLCLAGVGVAYLARFMVESELSDGRLIELPLKRAPRADLLLATRKGRDLPLTARTFLEHLR